MSQRSTVKLNPINFTAWSKQVARPTHFQREEKEVPLPNERNSMHINDGKNY